MGMKVMSISTIKHLKKKIGKDYVYFALQGRLGNQLFGLSDAFLLHKHFDLKIFLDLTYVSRSGFDFPWINFVDYDWLVPFRNIDKNSELYNSETRSMEKINNFSSLKGDELFNGFNPSIKNIEKSGLFIQGQFPFYFDKSTQIKLTDDLPLIAMSVRLGDYYNNPHLGIIKQRYYERSLKYIINNYGVISEIEVFSDDIVNSLQHLQKLPVEIYSNSQKYNSIINLYRMSNAKLLVLSNSTYAFWAGFFSNGTVIYPNPFYLAIPKWHKKLFWNGAIAIRSSYFPKLSYFASLVKLKFSKLFR